MAKFIKQALHVGQHFEAEGKTIPITPARLKHWSDQFGRLTAAKYNVPIDWDHGTTLDKLSPVLMSEQKKRRSAKNTVGELDSFKLAKDGKSAELTLKVSDPVAEGRAERNEVYISPVILESWKDGHGNEYQDVITHVDLVNHPVDHSQSPFKKLPETKEAGSLAMAIRMGLSAPSAIGDPPPKSDDDEGDKDADGDGTDDEDEDDASADATSPERVQRLLEALKAHDVVLPDDTDATNILERLEVALLTKAAIEGKDTGDGSNAGADGGNSQIKVTDPQGFQGMSLESKAALAFAERTHRKEVASRLKSALEEGRMTPAEFAEYEKKAGVIKLSLDSEGNPAASDVEVFLKHREAVPKGTFWSDDTRTQKMSLTVAEPPQNLRGGQLTDKEADDAANWALGKK